MTRRTIYADGAIVINVAGTKEALHAGVMQLYSRAGIKMQAAGKKTDKDTGELSDRQWRLIFAEDADPKTVKQRGFYWASVLPQIAKQAPGGWTADAWHEAFKRTVLGFEVVSVAVAGRKRKVTIRRLRSTEGLSIKQTAEYLDEVIDTATRDLGVTFVFDQDEREYVRHKKQGGASKLGGCR